MIKHNNRVLQLGENLENTKIRIPVTENNISLFLSSVFTVIKKISAVSPTGYSTLHVSRVSLCNALELILI